MKKKVKSGASKNRTNMIGTNQPMGKAGGVQTKLQKRRLRVLEAVFVILLGVAQFFNSPFHKFACLAAAFVCLWLALRIELRNFTATKPNATIWATGVCLGGVLLGGYALLLENVALSPHLTILLKTDKTAYRPLTNRFAIFEHPHIDSKAILAIPMEAGQSNFHLGFAVFNDSASDASNPDFAVGLPKGWNGVPGPSWLIVSNDTAATVDWHAPEQCKWFFWTTGLLKAGDHQPLSDIVINPDVSESGNNFMLMQIRLNGSRTLFACEVRFVLPVNGKILAAPVLVLPYATAQGKGEFLIPDEEFKVIGDKPKTSN